MKNNKPKKHIKESIFATVLGGMRELAESDPIPGASSQEFVVGDPVIITGDVQFQGKTGDVREIGRGGAFVVVDLYNYGPHSFHSSDVSYNDYADSDDEDDRMESVAEGSDYDGSEPLDLSTNPSVNDVFKRALYIYDYEGYSNDGDYSEDDAIDQYVASKFGQNVLNQLTTARNQQYFGRADGKGPGGGGRTSNLGISSAPGNKFRTTKAGKMHGQDAKMMKARVADRLGRHPEPNLPEQSVEQAEPTSELGDQAFEKTHKHRVGVTYSDPNHTAVSQRKETVYKIIRIPAVYKGQTVYQGEAEELAKKYYKKQGYRVHGVEYVGMVSANANQPSAKQAQNVPEDADERDAVIVNRLAWPEIVNQINSAMKATGWKGRRKDDDSYMFSTKGGLEDEWYIVTIENRGNNIFTYALGTVEEGEPHIGEQESLPMTAASVSELMIAVREGFGMADTNEGVLDGAGESDSPVASAIIRRILMQRTDLLAKYGPEKVGAAVDEVADFVGDVDEIGSSDVSGWIRHVEQMLGNMEDGVAEGTAYQYHVVSKLDGNVLASYKTREEAQKNAHGNPVVSGSLETIGDRQYTRGQGVAEGVEIVDQDSDLDQQVFTLNVDGETVSFTYWDYENNFQNPDIKDIYQQAREQLGKKLSPEQIKAVARSVFKSFKSGVAEGLPQTLRKIVPGYAKREIDRKMDAQKFGRTDVDKDANYYRYKKIQDKLKGQGVAEGSEQVYKVLAVDKSNALSKQVKLKVKASSLDEVFERLAINDWYPLEINGVEVINGKRLKQGVAEAEIDEKAKSKAQQKFMGMVYAAKQGEKPASPEVAKVAKGISKKAAKDYASTKHKGKPEHVKETGIDEARMSAAVKLQRAWERQRAKSDASLARTPSSIPKKPEPKQVAEAYGDVIFKVDGWTYQAQEDREEDNIKMFHDAIGPDGKRYPIDFNPYHEMTPETFGLWIKLGMPGRTGRGPLDNDQILSMAKSSGLTESAQGARSKQLGTGQWFQQVVADFKTRDQGK